jgi:hypothetical protein
MKFTAEAFVNPFVSVGAVDLHAVLTVSAVGEDPAVSRQRDRVEVVIIDCSGSMSGPATKIREAQRAAREAIDTLPEGTWFAVVAGRETAAACYPEGGGLVQAGPHTRKDAREAIATLSARGGTAFSRWLLHVRDLVGTRPDAQAHAVLITDGQNESEHAEDLRVALDLCTGLFQCDCRGVGAGWMVSELELISNRLMGTTDIVRRPEDLAAAVSGIVSASMRRTVDRVLLKVWTANSVTVEAFSQVGPNIQDVPLVEIVDIDPQVRVYTSGSWGAETRDYYLRLRLPACSAGERMRAARLRVVAGDGDGDAARADVKAVWTDDPKPVTELHPRVTHYQRQMARMNAVRAGIAASRRGDAERARREFGNAVRLAREDNNEASIRLLESLVHIDDADQGVVRLKEDVSSEDLLEAEARASRTIQITG